MSDAEDPIPKSDLTTRFAAAVAMIAVASVAIYLGGWAFRLLVAAGVAIMLVEWSDMHGLRRRWAWGAALLTAMTLLAAIEILFPAGEMDIVIVAESFSPALKGFAAAAGAALLLGLAARRIALGWGVIYIGIPAFALLVMSWIWFALVFWVMIVTWATDIFAYFAGRTIGGPKLAPRISPNKTWAGLIGGAAGGAAFGWLVAWLFEMGELFLWIGAPMAVAAQAGDLYESWVKRRAGVKDSGTILPGHGGVLDRADGLLAVVVATMALLMAGAWAA